MSRAPEHKARVDLRIACLTGASPGLLFYSPISAFSRRFSASIFNASVSRLRYRHRHAASVHPHRRAHLWSWLADRIAAPVRVGALDITRGNPCFLAYSEELLCAFVTIFAMTFFWSAASRHGPTTLTHPR